MQGQSCVLIGRRRRPNARTATCDFAESPHGYINPEVIGWTGSTRRKKKRSNCVVTQTEPVRLMVLHMRLHFQQSLAHIGVRSFDAGDLGEG